MGTQLPPTELCRNGRPSQLLLSTCRIAHCRVPLLYNGPTLFPLKNALRMGDLNSRIYVGSTAMQPNNDFNVDLPFESVSERMLKIGQHLMKLRAKV